MSDNKDIKDNNIKTEKLKAVETGNPINIGGTMEKFFSCDRVGVRDPYELSKTGNVITIKSGRMVEGKFIVTDTAYVPTSNCNYWK